jgi:hypothetical protein
MQETRENESCDDLGRENRPNAAVTIKKSAGNATERTTKRMQPKFLIRRILHQNLVSHALFK